MKTLDKLQATRNEMEALDSTTDYTATLKLIILERKFNELANTYAWEVTE